MVLAVVGVGLAPSPAAGGSRAPLLLYASDWSGQSEIYVASSRGGAVRGQLTFAPGGAFDPVSSPDGRHVLYHSHRSVQQQYGPVTLDSLWVIRADGKFRRQLWEGPTRHLGGVAWSPDSTRIAYVVDSLHVARADGSRDRIVGAPTPGCNAPAWSRDGRTVSPTCQDGIRSPDGRWTVKARRELLPSGRVSQLNVVDTRHPYRSQRWRAGSWPAWSPDSRWLAYAADDGIAILDPRTGRRHLLSRDRGFDLVWSPDGTRLAYLRGRGPGSDDFGVPLTGDLRTVTLSGRPHVAVSATRAYGGTIFSFAWTRQPEGLAYPRPSPTDGLYTGWPVTLLAGDGGRVAYATCAGVSVWDPPNLSTTDAFDVPEARRCDPAGYYQYLFSLALAGDRIAYTTADGGNTLVWSVGSATLAPTLRNFQLASGSQTCCLPLPPDVAGAGGLLVFDPYAANLVFDPHGPDWEIRQIGPAGCLCPVVTTFERPANGDVHLDDVEDNRIVVDRPDYLRILDDHGNTLLALSVRSPEAALSGQDLVVHVESELRDYDATTGALIHTWQPPGLTPPAPQPRRDMAHQTLQDAARGLAAYTLDGQIHLLRLTDGQDATVGAGTLARFTDEGLVYAEGARIHLVPFDRLPFR